MDQIIYLSHPVSAEDKRRWNADGFRIIDERFKPEELAQDEPKSDAATKRRGKRNALA